ncbi:MAG: nicotinate phosphoribosyltransferase [Deltaproteobacteria bacterium]|nr:nicotinate phosphoribosyltransferase [Deltaproteobacteria bacterium]
MTPSDRSTAEGILYTDQYQLTMAQLYYRMGLHEKPAQFEHFFRTYPDYGGSHKSGYCINAGLQWFLDWMKSSRFRKQDIRYLSHQKDRKGNRLFQDDFLKWLGKQDLFPSISLKAVPEGRVIHAGEPIHVIEGPLALAQLIETPLLNYLNYPILIATKAARVRESAGGQLVIDFGLRRGHERSVNAGIRAALIGGVDFSSGVGISCVLGFPPKGTHAHSMVQAFMALGEGELGAFRAYAEVYPDDCLLLVDTINTLESGIPNAIRVFQELRRKGHQPIGVRLDSGDLAYLSIQAARMLDDAGFDKTVIVLSNQLDELVIQQIISQIKDEAMKSGVDPDALIKRLVFGVGTRLITSEGDAALDGVYKLTALQEKGEWIPAIKKSESISKIINPGRKQVWRIYNHREKAEADVLAIEDENLNDFESIKLNHPTDPNMSRVLKHEQIKSMEPLLTDIIKKGVQIVDSPSITKMRAIRIMDMQRLDKGVSRLLNPHIYHVSLTEKLWRLKNEMIQKMDVR